MKSVKSSRDLSVYKADVLLLITAMIWGSAFVAQKKGMDFIGPFLYNAIRFALGSMSLWPLIYLRSRKNIKDNPFQTKDLGPVLKAGLIAGIFLFAGSSLQQVGLLYTSAGKAGFITGLYVVIVPVLGLFWRQFPALGSWIGALLAVGGLYLLSIKKGMSIGRGDFLVLLCAVMFALHILVIGRLAPKVDSIKLSSVQFAVIAVFSFIIALIFEEISLLGIWLAAIPILYGGLMSVGIAFTLQVIAQRDAPATHASILLSLETVFAAVSGWIILQEVLSGRALVGCALMLSGMLISQLWSE